MEWLKRPIAIAHWIAVVLALAVILASVTLLVVIVVYDKRVEEATIGRLPAQFRGQLDTDLLDDYGAVFGVAHNAGDSVGTAVRALASGADVLEIDVIDVNGRLYAGHEAPTRVFGLTEFRGPPIEDIWVVAEAAEAIELDLKSSTPAYLNRVIALLDEKRAGPRVVISTPSVAALRTVRERQPAAILLYSVQSQTALHNLQDNPQLQNLIDGVSIREDLVDEDTVSWLRDRQLLVWVWTVNEIGRLNELVDLGVDAVTSDNLAILELLGGDQRGERPLQRPLKPATPEPT
jgi:hypothetical protein